jgi:hypothetical protein
MREEAQWPWPWMVVEDRGGKQVQKTKEMGAKGMRMGVWMRTLPPPIYPPL